MKNAEAALLLDPGLGKTSVALAAFQALRKAGGLNKALVFAPLQPCRSVWTQEHGGEVARWSNFEKLRITFLHGPKKDERVYDDADIYVVNYEGARWLVENKHLQMLIRKGVNLLLLDELSRMKYTKTKLFRALRPHLSRFKRRWGLTGSPAPNGLLDLFGQMWALDLGRSLGRYVTHYRQQYFVPTGFKGYQWKIQTDAEPKIYKAISHLALSMRAEDHLDLPTLVERDVPIHLPPKARRTYDELEQEFIAAIDGELITAANAGVVGGKCRQIASGGVYVETDDPRKRRVAHAHHEKTDALVDFVNELQGRPLLVAYEFRHDLERIREKLGDVPVIGGGTTTKQATTFINAWNDGELPILCGHPASIGHGLNLQRGGSHICWYSLTWNFELYDQFNRRIWRQGSKAKRVIIHRLVARGTVDEVVAKALKAKKKRQDALMNALRDYASLRTPCTRR